MVLTKISLLSLFALALLSVTYAEVLADSSYPIQSGNALRNLQINKKTLCPEVATGRTQVWNIESEIQLPEDLYDVDESIQLTIDEDGSLHFHYATNDSYLATFIKIDPTTRTYNPALKYTSSLRIYLAPTHVKGHRMSACDGTKTLVLDTKTMQEIVVLEDNPQSDVGSYIPYGPDMMVKSNDITGFILTYLNSTSLKFDTSQPFNFELVYARELIIYTNASGVQIPIVPSSLGGNPIIPVILSPNYQIVIEDFYASQVLVAYVQNDELVVQYPTSRYSFIIRFFDPNTGVSLRNVSIDNWNGNSNSDFDCFRVFAACIASIVGDILNNKTILENFYAYGALFSIPSNSALMYGTNTAYTSNVISQIISVDWDDYSINAIGGFPTDGAEYSMSAPVIGDDCELYTYYTDYTSYKNKLYVFKPLPISNVLPILECVNAAGVAYFSYNNMENKRIIIPYVSDRNNLMPMNVAPAQDFRANQRGKHFPFSSPVQLSNSTTSFTWKLEDSNLSFEVSEQLRCPTNVQVIVVLSSSATSIPEGLADWVGQAFANVTQIGAGRVNVTSIKNQQGSIEVTLLTSPDPNGQEKTAEEVGQSFIQQRQFDALNQFVANSSYSSLGLSLQDVDGVPLDSEITVPIPPQFIPSSQPPASNNVPSDNTPISTPRNVPSTVSSGVILTSSVMSVLCLIMLM